MLTFVFFILAVLAAAAGVLLLAPGPQQMAVWGIAILFLALFVINIVRGSSRPWR
jgi:uncharacterized membrane protein